MVEITILKRSLEEAEQVQRKFFKKTAKGKVIKGDATFVRLPLVAEATVTVLRERYLRPDIACGFAECPECSSTSSAGQLVYQNTYRHKAFNNGHVLLPDTNVFLHQVRFVLFAEFLADVH